MQALRNKVTSRAASIAFRTIRQPQPAPALQATSYLPIHHHSDHQHPRHNSTMTVGTFKYIDPASFKDNKPWTKVDGGGASFTLTDKPREVEDIRPKLSSFTTDSSGFAVYQSPTALEASSFAADETVRGPYYAEVEALVRAQLPGVKKVVIFDHTIRKHDKLSPRQPVQQVHVDQTPRAAEARVRRHLPADEAEELLKGRFQIVNVWRPIANPATDFPLAVVDWRTTEAKDLVPVDLLYPKRDTAQDDGDDRGKESLPDPANGASTEGYEPKGETFGVAPNEKHRFYYVKDMKPDEAMFIKCFDSRGQDLPGGTPGVAMYTPHTAFIDPQTPADAPGRQSIEVRCLVFYE